MNVVIPLFLQSARGLEPLAASLTLAPGILLTVVLGPIAGRLFDRHGGRWSIPLGFLTMAVFVTFVGVAAGFDSILLFGALYVPAVLATAFIIGPAQTFALSHLDRETSPHGVTVVSTGFQIAGCVGTSLAAGIYGMLIAAGVRAGHGEAAALLTGFRGAVGLVVVTSLIGIVLAVLAHRASQSARRAAAAEAGAAGDTPGKDTVDAIMQTQVHALRSDQTVLQALQFFAHQGISGAPILDDEGHLVGYLSDGDVMRYLSAAHPSSTSIYSYAIGAADDLEHAMADLEDLDVLRLATRDVITVDSGSSIADAVAALSDVRLKKVPVVDEDGSLVGIVSRSAISRVAIAGYLHSREAQREPAHA
jgi:DHA2 family lincomycin resistance protein-like MFS transporter